MKSIDEVKREIYAIAGREFDIDSNSELAKVLFEELGLPPVMKDRNGYSVSDEALYPLITTPIVSAIWEYRNMKLAEGLPPEACVLEYDDFGRIVGWGSHADYDLYAAQVMNGEGYYDERGRYRSFGQEI